MGIFVRTLRVLRGVVIWTLFLIGTATATYLLVIESGLMPADVRKLNIASHHCDMRADIDLNRWRLLSGMANTFESTRLWNNNGVLLHFIGDHTRVRPENPDCRAVPAGTRPTRDGLTVYFEVVDCPNSAPPADFYGPSKRYGLYARIRSQPVKLGAVLFADDQATLAFHRRDFEEVMRTLHPGRCLMDFDKTPLRN